VIDQMRGDYLSRWETLFEDGGFRRLITEGAWFQDCHYPYANTMTGPGHATISTGCSPDVHGIIANEWYDRKAAREVNCVATERFGMVPPSTRKKTKGAAPTLLLAPTLADALKAATGGKARVVALSLKDRSAVLPGGTTPDACYWTDKDGRFVTSTFYRDREHSWVREMNRSGHADRWLGTKWERSRPDVDYTRWAGPDDVKGEGGKKYSRTFPHPLALGEKGEKATYYEAVSLSPEGNDLLLEMVRRAIDGEKLGTGETADFLSISFSSNDLVGHGWGPDSQEVLDVTLRTDVQMRALLDLLDEKVGKGKWVLALTADHGICPLPEVSRTRGKEARRINQKTLAKAAEEHLDSLFPPRPDEPKSKGKWKWIEPIGTEPFGNHMIYLDKKRVERRGVKQVDVEAALAKWLAAQPGILAAYTREQLAGKALPSDALTRKVLRSYLPERSGDVIFVPKPYHLVTDRLTGTTHGTPHPYDTHVPLVVVGPGVRPGQRSEPVTPEHTAVILAHALGIDPPAKAVMRLPEGLFEQGRK
jgi:hypothetical protein